MIISLVVIGIVAVLSTGLAAILMFRLLNKGGGSQDSALAHQVGEIRQGMDRVNEAIQSLNVDRARQTRRPEPHLCDQHVDMQTLGDSISGLSDSSFTVLFG